MACLPYPTRRSTMSLQEAVDEIFRICGEDGEARSVLTFAHGQESDPQFTSEENIALRDLALRLYESFGVGPQSRRPWASLTSMMNYSGPLEEAGSPYFRLGRFS